MPLELAREGALNPQRRAVADARRAALELAQPGSVHTATRAELPLRQSKAGAKVSENGISGF
jgi:hypothetical protein